MQKTIDCIQEYRTENDKVVINHFDALAPVYDEKSNQREKYLKKIDSIIINILKEKTNVFILDVGCGTGSRILNIVKSINARVVYGVDISKEMVKIAKTRKVQVVLGDMVSLDLEVKNFDAVLCLFNCFGYLDTYKKRVITLQNFSRHLKKEGLLFIDVMNMRHRGEGITFKRTTKDILKDFFLPFYDPALGFGNKRFKITINNTEVAGFVHGFYDIEMRWMLKKAGFRVVQSYIVGYDSGEVKTNSNEGQLFYVCQKK